MSLDHRTIEQPTLLVDRDRVRRNVERMADKARRSHVRLRPHFKTHQSARIGEWIRSCGVEAITVPSVAMAEYFAKHGWSDITLAFPLNWRQIERINRLAKTITLHLLIDCVESARFLATQLKEPASVWIDVDTGYERTGIWWEDQRGIEQTAEVLNRASAIELAGALTHAGHTYHVETPGEIVRIHDETVDRMNHVREALSPVCGSSIAVSIGDTPGCSVVDDLGDVDEIRPGNFVLYDVKQWRLSACTPDDIAVVVACPIVAKYEQRNEIVIYGGAVHLSKDWIVDKEGRSVFGYPARWTKTGWEPAIDGGIVSSLSQEVGVVKASKGLFQEARIGDLLAVLPIHSCLTVSAMKHYISLDGERIDCLTD